MSETRPPIPPGLGWRRRLARLVLWFERVLPAVLPAARVAGVFLCLALLDVLPLLPWWAHAAVLAGTALAIGVLLWRGLAAIIPPDAVAADRRLEKDSGLAHRPLAALSDPPATDDPASLALWRAHVARGLARARRLRLRAPHPGLAALDLRAFRHAVLLCLVAALVIAGRDAPDRLLAAFQPGIPRPTPGRAVQIQAWITPPAYTGLAPMFLRPDHPAVSVPVGAHLTVNLTGGAAVPNLVLNDKSTPFASLDQTSFQADRTLAKDSRLGVTRDGETLAQWDIKVIQDLPPVAWWTQPPGPSEATSGVRLPWSATDDYGVTDLRAELRLTARPDAPPLVIPIPLPSGADKSVHGIHPHNLIAHPWAGLSVTARLIARDGANQTGTSDPATFVLPERAFHNEIAKALIEMRKGLSLHPDDHVPALTALDELMQKPELFGDDSGAFLNLSAIYYLMVLNKSPAMVPEAQARMWDLALYLEEGQTNESARELEAARRAVRDAMEKLAEHPTDANREALEQKLKDLQAAIDRNMQAMLEQAERDHEALPFDPQAEKLSNQDLDRLAEEARQDLKAGQMDAARDKLAELERQLDRLKRALADKGRGNSQQRQKAHQQMGAVQDMVGREGGLLDHSESRSADASQPRQIEPRPSPPPDPAAAAQQRPMDQRVQGALRHALGEMMQQFGDLTGEIPPALGQADMAMRDSATALGAGDDQAAAANEQKAIEALQKGAHEMGRTLAKQFGRGQPGGEAGDGDGDSFGAEGSMGMMMPDGQGDGQGGSPMPDARNRADSRGRDPLGRTNQGDGLDTADVRIPEQAEHKRSQEIQEELRRRGADRERPQEELDYINRLLKQF